jgi:DNA repair exonuclease SbcCD ATPase subunit
MPVRSISTRLTLEGEAEYKSKMSSVNGEIKTLGSELKLVESRFADNANSMEALTAKGDVLQRQYEAQSQKLALFTERLNAAQEAQQSATERGAALAESVSAQKDVIEEYKNKLAESTDGTIKFYDENGNLIRSVDNGAEEVKKLENELSTMQKTLADSEREQRAAANTVNDYQRQVNNAEVELNKLSREVQENKKHLTEAKTSADGCATSIDRYGKQVKQAGDETQTASEKMSVLQKAFTAGGVAANLISQGISAAWNALKSLVRGAIETSDELLKMSDVSGRSVEELQQLQYVADDTGASLDTIEAAQKKLTKSMDEARDGGKEYTEAFKTLKVDAVDPATGALRDSKTVFFEMLDALGKVGNETERDALAMQIFGKSATELNPLIKAGSDELNTLMQKAKDTGAVMSEDAVRGLDMVGDALDHTKQQAQAYVGEIVGKLIPAQQSVSDINAEIAEKDQTAELIKRYQTLTRNIESGTLSSGELKDAQSELATVKQKLIELSDGLISAVAEENGTLDEQISKYGALAEAEKKLLTSQLLLKASSYAADLEKQKGLIDETTSVTNIQTDATLLHLEAQQKLADMLINGASTSELMKQAEQVALLGIAVNGTIIGFDGLAGVTDNSTQKFNENKASIDEDVTAIKGLAATGMTAQQIATELGVSLDVVNSLLKGADEGGGGASTTSMEERVKSLTTQMTTLAAQYDAAKEKAYNSINQQLGLFNELDGTAKTSIDNLIKTLSGQVDYMTTYNENIKKAMEIGVDEGLVKKLSDGSEQSAQILAAIVADGGKKIPMLNEEFKKVEEGKEAFSKTVAEMETDFKEQMTALTVDLNNAIGEMNVKTQTYVIGVDNIQGLILGAESQKQALADKYTSLATAALTAYKAVMNQASPSKTMAEVGKFDFEGLIAGAESMRKAVGETYKSIAREAINGFTTAFNFSEPQQEQKQTLPEDAVALGKRPDFRFKREDGYRIQDGENNTLSTAFEGLKDTLKLLQIPAEIKFIINSTEFARAILPDLREVSKSSPEITPDF